MEEIEFEKMDNAQIAKLAHEMTIKIFNDFEKVLIAHLEPVTNKNIRYLIASRAINLHFSQHFKLAMNFANEQIEQSRQEYFNETT